MNKKTANKGPHYLPEPLWVFPFSSCLSFSSSFSCQYFFLRPFTRAFIPQHTHKNKNETWEWTNEQKQHKQWTALPAWAFVGVPFFFRRSFSSSSCHFCVHTHTSHTRKKTILFDQSTPSPSKDSGFCIHLNIPPKRSTLKSKKQKIKEPRPHEHHALKKIK